MPERDDAWTAMTEDDASVYLLQEHGAVYRMETGTRKEPWSSYPYYCYIRLAEEHPPSPPGSSHTHHHQMMLDSVRSNQSLADHTRDDIRCAVLEDK